MLLGGCDTAPGDAADPRACFPELARPWIHVAAASQAKPDENTKAGTATVYVDRSGSMAGYIAGATAAERPFQDLIGTLPATLSALQLSAGYRAFGTRISPVLKQEEQGALARAAYYSCGSGPDCDNKESRLDGVFTEISRKNDGLALVVSDLWFTNSDVQTSGLAALAEPLAQILASGRAVAVYGIAAPFNGRIFDLPFGGGAQPFRGQHPLYLIAVGSDAQIAGFQDAWKRSPSPYLAQELAAGRIKRTVFTLNPAKQNEGTAAPLTGGTDPRITAAPVLESRENLLIQEFSLAAKDAFRPAPGTTPPQWVGPREASFTPDSAWQGQFTTRTRAWERRSKTCTDADWLETSRLDQLWEPAAGTGPRTFTLNPERLATALSREGTYLITAEVERTEVASRSPAAEWMRKWSFSPADTNPVRAGMSGEMLFPTLHVSEFARLLENALATASKRKPTPIVGFSFVVEVQ
jgi:hypothetical protein